MTLVDVAPDSGSASPSRRGGLRWVVGVLVAVTLVVGAALVSAAYYYDGVPVPNPAAASYPVVPVTDLPPPVANALVAAVDPDFYTSGGTVLTSSLITRRYLAIASGTEAGEVDSWRVRVMADKFGDMYTQTEILGFYLNSADYGRGAVGLVAAAQAYFQKPAARLSVAEAALLGLRLDPDRPASQAGWEQVLDTMVERGWLSRAERGKLAFPTF